MGEDILARCTGQVQVKDNDLGGDILETLQCRASLCAGFDSKFRLQHDEDDFTAFGTVFDNECKGFVVALSRVRDRK